MTTDSPPHRVATRVLGATDVRVSEIALGCWGLAAQSYGKVESAQFEATVRAAWEAGVTTFDIAPTWGDGAGERRLGLALGSDLANAVIVGRVGQTMVEGRVQAQFDAPAIVRDVEQSLQRLGRSTIDVLLLHNPPPKVIATEFFLKGVSYLQTSGMIRCWGASVGTLEEARLAIEHGAQVLCLVYNLAHRTELPDLVSQIEARGIGVLVRSPLLYGVLSGRFTADTKHPEDDHRSRRWSEDAWKRRLDDVERYRFLVAGDVPDLATAALRFVLSSPVVGAAIVGARTPEQIRHAALASREPPYLPADHVAKLATL